MSLTYPTFDELIQQARAEMQTQLPGIDPTVGGSWAKAFVDGSAVMTQILTYLVRDLEKQLFPQSATGEFLDLWGNYEGLGRIPATGASGYVTIEGVAGTLIPVSTNLTGTNGYNYTTQTAASISDVTQSITSITRSGTIATVICPDNHHLATGSTVTVSGADQSEYNVTTTVTVTGLTTFQYSITGTPVTPATGTIKYLSTYASVLVESTDTGEETNIESGGLLSNDNYKAVVQYEGLVGGYNEETDDNYRERILLSRSIISGVFTPDQIKLAALSVSGNTRVFVKKPSLSVCSGASGDYTNPIPGQVSVFIMRDSGSVTQSIIDETKQTIIEDGALPAEMSEADLFVQAPDEVPTTFTFSALSPDTPTMRTAIENQLAAYFNDDVDFETNVTQTEYLCAIQSSQSITTGEYLQTFTLSSPVGDIAVGDGEIATLGGVTYV